MRIYAILLMGILCSCSGNSNRVNESLNIVDSTNSIQPGIRSINCTSPSIDELIYRTDSAISNDEYAWKTIKSFDNKGRLLCIATTNPLESDSRKFTSIKGIKL